MAIPPPPAPKWHRYYHLMTTQPSSTFCVIYLFMAKECVCHLIVGLQRTSFQDSMLNSRWWSFLGVEISSFLCILSNFTYFSLSWFINWKLIVRMCRSYFMLFCKLRKVGGGGPYLALTTCFIDQGLTLENKNSTLILDCFVNILNKHFTWICIVFSLQGISRGLMDTKGN